MGRRGERSWISTRACQGSTCQLFLVTDLYIDLPLHRSNLSHLHFQMATLAELLRPNNDLAMALLNMQTSELMCDINLVAEDNRVIKAHKLVLVAMSPFFHNMYLNGNDFTTFQFKKASAVTVTKLVQFLYGNVFAINAQNAKDIYPFATLLELTHVTKVCEYFDPSVKDMPYDFSETYILPVLEGGSSHQATEAEIVSPKQRRLSEPFASKRKRLERTLSLLPKTNKKMMSASTESLTETQGTVVKPERRKSASDPGEVLFQCNVCDVMCSSLKAMESHVLNQHKQKEELSDDSSECAPISTEDTLDENLPPLPFKFGVADLPKQVQERTEEFTLWSEMKVITPLGSEKRAVAEEERKRRVHSGGSRKK